MRRWCEWGFPLKRSKFAKMMMPDTLYPQDLWNPLFLEWWTNNTGVVMSGSRNRAENMLLGAVDRNPRTLYMILSANLNYNSSLLLPQNTRTLWWISFNRRNDCQPVMDTLSHPSRPPMSKCGLTSPIYYNIMRQSKDSGFWCSKEHRGIHHDVPSGRLECSLLPFRGARYACLVMKMPKYLSDSLRARTITSKVVFGLMLHYTKSC